MEINFKTLAFAMLLLGGGYAWYTGLLDGFFSDFGGQLSTGGSAARQVE